MKTVILVVLLLACPCVFAGTVTLGVTPHADDAATPGLWFRLYGGKCGEPKTLLAASQTRVFVRTSSSTAEHCYHFTAGFADTQNQLIVSTESQPSNELRVRFEERKANAPTASVQ